MSPRLIAAVAVVVVAAAAAFLFRSPPPPPAASAAPASVPARPAPTVQGTLPPLGAPEPAALASGALPPFSGAAAQDLAAPSPGPGALRIPADRPVARIGARTLTAREVFPDATGAEIVTEPGELSARVERAIDREVTLSAARAAGLDPEAEVATHLARVKAQQAEAAARMKALGAEWSSATDASMAFEARDLAAVSLQQRLLATAGTPPPVATPEAVAAYLAAHPNPAGEGPPEARARRALVAEYDAAARAQLSTLRKAQGAERVLAP